MGMWWAFSESMRSSCSSCIWYYRPVLSFENQISIKHRYSHIPDLRSSCCVIWQLIVTLKCFVHAHSSSKRRCYNLVRIIYNTLKCNPPWHIVTQFGWHLLSAVGLWRGIILMELHFRARNTISIPTRCRIFMTIEHEVWTTVLNTESRIHISFDWQWRMAQAHFKTLCLIHPRLFCPGYRSKIWQLMWLQCCRGDCQFRYRSVGFNSHSHNFEFSGGLAFQLRTV